MSIRSLAFIFVVLLISNITQASNLLRPYVDEDKFFEQKTSNHEIRIMSVNAHNLYDDEHDEGFFDFTYLPMNHPAKAAECETITHPHYKNLCFNLDWTYEKVFKKIGQLGVVIREHGSLPDILALQEIENERVIAQLAKHVGYKDYVVTNFKNKRGVDLALLYRTKALEYVGQEEIYSPARAALRVHFKTKPSNKDLFVYVNHWIAQSAPTFYRVKSAKAIQEDITRLHEEYNNPSIVLIGDFNTRFDEAKEVFEDTFMDKNWEHHLIEAHDEALGKYPEFSKHFPKGSYWRGKNNWERFDRIFMSNNLLKQSNKLRADLRSYRLIYSQKITGEYKFKTNPDDENSDETVVRYPLKYNFLENPKYPLGFTDHLPSTITLFN